MSDRITPPLFAPARWQELRVLAEHLEALDTAVRERELAKIAAHDSELAAAARDLLTEATRDPARPEAAIERLISVAEAVPQRIGPFEPVRRIGAGGMGTVWLAERRDADYAQRVALKLLDGDAARVAHLAARERRVLAALSHPNITAFVDAGIAYGREWLAMEYVDGVPLLSYCAMHMHDARARVALFDQVCAAVAYAHSQLVVHRDLKPSNVLVTGEGTVKLLDFGIARVLDASDEHTPATRLFTPEYAAPEQLRGERATTATDVYALGLMLYELLSDRRLPTLQRNGADTDWTTAALARHASAPDASAHTVTHNSRELRGDLGRILVHALAADPMQRYGTVAQLRADLKRWLEYRPLTIARPALRYVAARFVRRNRITVAIAAIAVLGLLASNAFALWQAHEARLMAARAEHARSFLNTLFLNADPYNAKHGAETMVGFLRDAGRRIDTEFADAPDMAILLRSTIASALLRLDQPKPAHELYLRNLDQTKGLYGTQAPQVGETLSDLARSSEDSGDFNTAQAQFKEAYAMLQNAGDAYASARISAMTGLAKMANRRSDYTEAQRWHEAVLSERQTREGPSSPDIAMDLMNLSNNALYREHFAESERFGQQAHAMLAQLLGADHPRMIYIDNVLGAAQLQLGKCAAAVATLEHAVAIARRNLSPGAPMLGSNLTSLGCAQACAGDDNAAIASLREGLSIFTAAHSPAIGNVELRLGLVQLHAHDSRALQTLDASRTDLAAAEAHLAGSAVNALWAEAADGDAIAINGDTVGGERLARDARHKLQAGKDSGSVVVGEVDLLLADVLDRKSEPVDARALREEALTVFARVYGADHPRTHELDTQLAVATQR